MVSVFRVQDGEGRGPYKPGVSVLWCDDVGPPPPPPFMLEFPGLEKRFKPPWNYGAGVRRLEQLAEWFSPTERLRLERMGYRVVKMAVDRIIAESKHQIIFRRAQPLALDVEVIDWAAIDN